MAGSAGGGSGPTIPPPTDSGVCAISPSDLVGSVGNLINVVKELQQDVAELKAQNVEVNQLSDLSQNVGWVGGIEYMGVPGWTQTEYGSLIPPPGVSLSSLGIFPPTIPGGAGQQLVIYDEDGNLVFGADTVGQLSGSGISGVNTLVASALSQTLGFGEFVDFSVTHLSSGISISGDTATLESPGTYVATLQIEAVSWSTPPVTTDSLYIRFNTQCDGSNLPFLAFPSDSASSPDPMLDTRTVVFHKSAGDTSTFKVEMRSNGSVDLTATLAIVQLNGR